MPKEIKEPMQPELVSAREVSTLLGCSVRTVYRLKSKAIVVVRARFEKDVAELYDLGADVVVMEELEASYELNRVVLEHFKIPQSRVSEHLDRVRQRKEFLIEQAIFKRAEANKG